MLGIGISSRGNYKSHNGKNYYFVETTYPDWGIGDVDPQMDDLSLWYVDDLDSDKMKIDFKYDVDEETKIKKKISDQKNNRDSGKRDKASPSNK
jgi:hypothetical protein